MRDVLIHVRGVFRTCYIWYAEWGEPEYQYYGTSEDWCQRGGRSGPTGFYDV